MVHIIIGERIRGLREDRDYTQQDIARLLHCSQVGYSNYETGKRCLPLECLIKLADFYSVSADYILGITDVRTRYSEGRYRQMRADELLSR